MTKKKDPGALAGATGADQDAAGQQPDLFTKSEIAAPLPSDAISENPVEARAAGDRPHGSQAEAVSGGGGHHPPEQQRNGAIPPGCRLADYAAAKRLPIEFLRGVGLSEITYQGAPAVKIPYAAGDGAEIAARFCIALDGKDRFRWRNGSKPCLYGLNRLGFAREVVIVEDESDAQTLWFHGFAALGLEHILPQKWQENWALPAVENAHFERERRLHGIGNLTLVSGKLNPTLSNAAWAESAAKRGKRSALDDHSKLQLNAKLVKANPDNWDEAAIDKRAVELFKVASKIWPQPPGFPEVVISGDDVAVSKAPPEFLPPPIEPPKYLPSERIIERGHRLATRQTKVSFRGSEGNFRTDKGAYIWLLRKFVAAFPDLMKTASYAIKSNERLFFARTPQELFTASPHLAEDHQKYAQITDEGDLEKWFANVNIDTQRTKLLNLDLLSNIAGFKRGEDWTWEQKRDYIEVLDL